MRAPVLGAVFVAALVAAFLPPLGAPGVAAGGRSGSGSDSTEESTTLPLLELGFKHAFSDTLRLTADASGVKKNVETTDNPEPANA